MIPAYLDFETKSEVDIEKEGGMKYVNGKEADIICLGYNVNKERTKIWRPGEELPDWIKYSGDFHKYAHNATFDYRVWNILGKKYGFPKSPIREWTDVMALCGRFTYPQSLAKAGQALALKTQKQTAGKALIKKICTPPYHYTRNDMMEFLAYCRDDVDSMIELIDALPTSSLSPGEQEIWEMTVKINNRGVPVDLKSVNQIIKVVEAYKIEQNALLPKLTNHQITKATQTKRITIWLRKQGVKIPNLQAATVEKFLQKDLPPQCKLILQLRQELGRSSTAKYIKILQQAYRNRVFDNLRYYGANTGRWAGLGFQIHNLPRSKVVDAEPILAKFFDLSVIEENPVAVAKTLVRSMIKAPKGRVIVAADYKSIENVGLAWVTHDDATLQLFIDGLDQYIDMATYIYNKPYDEITEDERQFGKVVILGCGYGLGSKGFMDNAAGWGIIISLGYATDVVNMYREKYRRVRNMWYACARAAINAVHNPGHVYRVYDCYFKLVRDRNGTRWLQLKLPSGRNLYYNEPLVEEGKFGPQVTCMGINPYTKKWMRMGIRPGRYVENIVQAVSRDFLAHGKLNLIKHGFDLIGSVHDEPIAEADEDKGQETLDLMCELICAKPTWALNMPLMAEGFFGKRYRKF